MKRCPECYAFYEDDLDVCPTCGERLERHTGGGRTAGRAEQSFAHEYQAAGETARTGDPYVFEVSSGNSTVINGAVAEVSTQQYYQSKFTKFFQAVFSGEPYQLSHTSFVTLFRVEEHTTAGYPEQARDITLYGNAQNIFAVGDDVTVTARRRGTQLIARNVYNHSINSDVRVQPNIPAGVIRFFVLLLCVALVIVVCAIATADYAAMGNAAVAAFSSILPLLVVAWLFWHLIKSFFRK